MKDNLPVAAQGMGERERRYRKVFGVNNDDDLCFQVVITSRFSIFLGNYSGHQVSYRLAKGEETK
jgi:hypothetical protein